MSNDLFISSSRSPHTCITYVTHPLSQVNLNFYSMNRSASLFCLTRTRIHSPNTGLFSTSHVLLTQEFMPSINDQFSIPLYFTHLRIHSTQSLEYSSYEVFSIPSQSFCKFSYLYTYLMDCSASLEAADICSEAIRAFSLMAVSVLS